jgi:Gluconate 2-dehydrogenase subunit 3
VTFARHPNDDRRAQRVDRRTTIQWILAAAAAGTFIGQIAVGRGFRSIRTGYGTNPDVQRTYKPGELWPLTFNYEQHRVATILCDTILPADPRSPGASQVGVVDFIDEWISAPYAGRDEKSSFALDRALILDGFEWLDNEAVNRFARKFADLDERQRAAICDEICYPAAAKREHERPARFFSRFRELTLGGFYTTRVGMKDIGYVGNVALVTFDGPPREVLAKLGLYEAQ